jgi:hypothetical protein
MCHDRYFFYVNRSTLAFHLQVLVRLLLSCIGFKIHRSKCRISRFALRSCISVETAATLLPANMPPLGNHLQLVCMLQLLNLLFDSAVITTRIHYRNNQTQRRIFTCTLGTSCNSCFTATYNIFPCTSMVRGQRVRIYFICLVLVASC